jgi:hypothetical protein
MSLSRPLPLSVHGDNVVLEKVDLPVFQGMPRRWQRKIDNDGDLVLGYTSGQAAARIDLSLGQVRWYS